MKKLKQLSGQYVEQLILQLEDEGKLVSTITKGAGWFFIA